MLSVAAHLGGCFVPPILELEADGGGTNIPRIRADLTEPQPGSTFLLRQTASGTTTPVQQKFDVWMFDSDSPTLHARLFVDRGYDQMVAEVVRSGCNTSTLCTANFLLSGPCDAMVNNVLGPHLLEVYISDQPWPDSDTSDLRKLEPGAFGVNDHWIMNCDDPEQTSDGGAS